MPRTVAPLLPDRVQDVAAADLLAASLFANLADFADTAMVLASLSRAPTRRRPVLTATDLCTVRTCGVPRM